MSRTRLLATVLCLLSAAATVRAQQDSPWDSIGRELLEYQDLMGETELWQAASEVLAPTDDFVLFDDRASDSPESRPSRDMTVLLLKLRQEEEQLTGPFGELMMSLLARPTAARRRGRPGFQVAEETPHRTTHFEIHYVKSTRDAPPPADDADSDGVPDFVEQAGEILEQIWREEVNRMGFRSPPNDGAGGAVSRYDVYLQDIGPDFYGWVAPESDTGSGWTSYMVLDNDYSSSQFPAGTATSNLQITVAHEFHHAVQFAYGTNPEPWYMEATSTWIEEQIFDSIDDNRQFLPDLFHRPELSLDSERDEHEYAVWVWLQLWTERFGPQIVRETWEDVATSGSSVFAVTDGQLARRGSSLAATYQDFALRMLTRMRRYDDPDLGVEPWEEGGAFPKVATRDWTVPSQSGRMDPLSSTFVRLASLGTKPAMRLDLQADPAIRAVLALRMEDGRIVELPFIPSTSGRAEASFSGLNGATPEPDRAVEEVIVALANTALRGTGKSYSLSSYGLRGPDPMIRAVGASWGFRAPLFSSPDVGFPDGGVRRGGKAPVVVSVHNLGDAEAKGRARFEIRGGGSWIELGDEPFEVKAGDSVDVTIQVDLEKVADAALWPDAVPASVEEMEFRVTLDAVQDIIDANNELVAGVAVIE